MKQILCAFLVTSIALVTAGAQTQNLDSPVSHALRFAQQELKQTVTEIGNSAKFAVSTQPDGSWKTAASRD